MQYLKNPAEIYAKSFSIVRAEVRLDNMPEDLQAIAIRIMHSSGMTDLAPFIRFDERIAEVTRSALKRGASILTDSEMTAAAIIKQGLPADNQIICTLNKPGVKELAVQKQTTRSAAAIELWKDYISNSVVVIGNAPTSLFALLEFMDRYIDRPLAIFAFPVGLVGASESKQELIDNSRGVPFVTLSGRRGGSAMAGAAINALIQTPSPQYTFGLTGGNEL